MPATCLVEVESWKSKEGPSLFNSRQRGFFLSYFRIGQVGQGQGLGHASGRPTHRLANRLA